MSNELKTCPVCHSVCFSDMDICYGCLHRFSDEGRIGKNGVTMPDENFEPEEPNISSLRDGLVPGAKRADVPTGADAVTAKLDGDCYELGLTIRIPREFLCALKAS